MIPDHKELLNRIADYEQRFSTGLRKLVTDQYQQLDYFQERLKQSLSWNYQKNLLLLRNLACRLEELNPLAVLTRGYSIVKKDGKALQSADAVAIGDIIEVLFAENSFTAQVTGKNYGQKI